MSGWSRFETVSFKKYIDANLRQTLVLYSINLALIIINNNVRIRRSSLLIFSWISSWRSLEQGRGLRWLHTTRVRKANAFAIRLITLTCFMCFFTTLVLSLRLFARPAKVGYLCHSEFFQRRVTRPWNHCTWAEHLKLTKTVKRRNGATAVAALPIGVVRLSTTCISGFVGEPSIRWRCCSRQRWRWPQWVVTPWFTNITTVRAAASASDDCREQSSGTLACSCATRSYHQAALRAVITTVSVSTDSSELAGKPLCRKGRNSQEPLIKSGIPQLVFK